MTRNTRLSVRFWSWVKRLGKKKALVALGHTLLRIIYHLLLRNQPYTELGSDYLELLRKQREDRKEADMIKHLETKGFIITQQS